MQSGDHDWQLFEYEGWQDYAPYYRSFWYGLGNGKGDIMGYGVHGQVLHVVPSERIVVAVFAHWPNPHGDGEAAGWGAAEAFSSALIREFSDYASSE